MDVLDLYADTPSHRYDTEGAITYQTCYGFWKYSFTGKWYFADLGSTHWRQATIREEGIRMKGKHYDYVIEDDMIDAYKYALGSLTIGEQECYNCLTKGDDKMTKYLFHIILFNTETEQIDFKGYIAASSDDDARMLAAQTYGKFNTKVHATNCKQIMSYGK